MKIYSNDIPEEDKVLRTKSKELSLEEIQSDEIKTLIDNMWAFLEEQPDGAGLSAPQVGVNKRIFILNPKIFTTKISYEDATFINPKIVKTSKEKIKIEEGCFSVRWVYGVVERFKKIKVEYLNRNGEKKDMGLSRFLSAAFQHENDHLDGILFIDKAISTKKLSDEEIKKLIDEWKSQGYKVYE